MTIVKSADCTEIITVMTKMVTACVTAVLVRLIHMREVKTMTDDTISRAAAIKALEETKQSDPFNRYEYHNIGIDWGIDAIKALPPAQPDIETLLKLAVAMAKPIEYLNLSVRSYNALKRRGVDSVAKVYELKQKENLKKIRNIGAKSADEIEDCLSAYLVQWEGGQDE